MQLVCYWKSGDARLTSLYKLQLPPLTNTSFDSTCTRERTLYKQNLTSEANMSQNASNGKKAIEASDYKIAVEEYTLALKTNPAQPQWLIQRAIAYQRLSQYDLSLIDAENGVLAARARAKRELIVDAQFRRALALRGLGRFGDARLCLTYVRKLDEKYKALGMWQQMIVSDFDKAGGEGAEANKTSIKEIPEKHEEVGAVVEEKKATPKKEVVKEDKGKGPEVKVTPVTATPKEQIRHEFYQSVDKLTITVFAKGVPKDKGEVIINEGSVSIILYTGNWDI